MKAFKGGDLCCHRRGTVIVVQSLMGPEDSFMARTLQKGYAVLQQQTPRPAPAAAIGYSAQRQNKADKASGTPSCGPTDVCVGGLV